MEAILEQVGFSGEYCQDRNFKQEEMRLENQDASLLLQFFVEKAEQALVKARLLYGVLDYGVVASVVPEASNRTQEIDGILRGLMDWY